MILYVINDHPSVSETFVVTEAAAVARLGVPVVVYALRRGGAPEPAAEVDVLCAPPSRIALAVGALLSPRAIVTAARRVLTRAITPREGARLVLAAAHCRYAATRARARGVEHIHAHFLARPADVAAALAERLGVGWTATAHATDIYGHHVSLEPNLTRDRLDSIATVVCENDYAERVVRTLARGAPPATTVVRSGVDLSKATFHAARAEQDLTRLVTVGRLVRTKGYWTILAAAADLLARHPDVHWTVIGDGPLRDQLRADPRTLALAGRLEFAGARGHEETLAALAASDLLVLPAEMDEIGDADGIPNVLMEAMALGVPVVTTDVAGIPELVAHERTGFVVPQADPAALTRMLDELLAAGARARIEPVRVAARQKVEAEYDASTQARAMLTVFAPHLSRHEGSTAPRAAQPLTRS